MEPTKDLNHEYPQIEISFTLIDVPALVSVMEQAIIERKIQTDKHLKNTEFKTKKEHNRDKKSGL